MEDKRLGKILRDRRLELNFTLIDLEKLTGIGKSTIGRYEQTGNIPLDRFKILCDKLNLEESDVLTKSIIHDVLDAEILNSLKELTDDQKQAVLAMAKSLKNLKKRNNRLITAASLLLLYILLIKLFR